MLGQKNKCHSCPHERNWGWTSNLGQDLEEAISAQQVESLCEIYEGNEEWLSLFPAFLVQLSKGEDHDSSGPVCPEPTL